jgi:hypothetical protein
MIPTICAMAFLSAPTVTSAPYAVSGSGNRTSRQSWVVSYAASVLLL